MAIFNQFPWVNYQEYNLDWIIKKIKDIETNINNIVIGSISDMLDPALTDPQKAAQAKATGDAISANASNITNLGSRMTVVENKNNTQDGLIQTNADDITSLGSRMTVVENKNNTQDGLILTNTNDIITLSQRIANNKPKDYKFRVYYDTDSYNDPQWLVVMDEGVNTLTDLLSDLTTNQNKPVNCYAWIGSNPTRTVRVSNLTTVVANQITIGVEFDAGPFHCKFVNTNSTGPAYFNTVEFNINADDSITLVQGDYFSIRYGNPHIRITSFTQNGAFGWFPFYINYEPDPDHIYIYYIENCDDFDDVRYFAIDRSSNVSFP